MTEQELREIVREELEEAQLNKSVTPERAAAMLQGSEVVAADSIGDGILLTLGSGEMITFRGNNFSANVST